MVVDLGLNSVQRPENVAKQWGEYTLAPADSSGFTYEDGLISLAVVPGSGAFVAVVENRTEHSIRLLWAEGSFVGPSGLSSGIVPGGTRWIDMGNAPAAEVIPSRARAAITVIPKATANTSSMTIEPFYPGTAQCDEVQGTTLRLILPIEFQGVTNEYTLLFEPASAGIAQWERDAISGETREIFRSPCSGG